MCIFFFFKQKTAYEMRISDWSSDVCSSDLILEQNRKDGIGGSIEVKPFGSLLMHFAEEQGATVIIRGLRAVSDFEYEFQMAGMNARLNPRIETLFLMASDRYQFISSRFVKEIGRAHV